MHLHDCCGLLFFYSLTTDIEMLENHKRSAIRMVVMSSSEDYNGKHTSVHNGHCSFLCYVSCGIGFLLPFVHVNSFGHIETLPPFYRTQST